MKYRCNCDTKFNIAQSQAGGNSLYTSWRIQNEIINLIGQKLIDKIVVKIKSARYFSVIFDETTDISGLEQISFVLRYYHSPTNKIIEQFVGFKDCFDELEEGDKLSLTGLNLGKIVIQFIKKIGLDIKFCTSLGTDGCSVMSSVEAGAVATIKTQATVASHSICLNHCINLSVNKSCSIPDIEIIFKILKKTYNFFNSAKRKKILCEIQDKLGNSGKLINMCVTRWVEKNKSVNSFVKNLKPIVDSLQYMIENDFSPQIKQAAHEILNSIQNSKFICCLFSSQFILNQINGLSVYLQSPKVDIGKAYKLTKSTCGEFQNFRKNVHFFDNIYEDCKKTCSEIGIFMTLSRNVQDFDKKKYYRENVFNPMIDELISDMSSRITSNEKRLTELHQIIISGQNMNEEALENILNHYACILPEFQNIPDIKEQLKFEITHFEGIENDDIIKAIKDTKTIFPVLHELLKIFITTPPSVASAERSFSKLKLIKTYLRNTMKEDRLSNIAIINSNKNEIESCETYSKLFS